MSNILQKLWRQESGNVVLLVGLGLAVLVGSAGAAVDMGRAQLVRSKLSSAIDAAGLAAGTVVHSEDVKVTATKYFKANFPDGYMDTTLKSFDVVMNADKTLISINASVDMATNIMNVYGIDEVQVDADTEITRANKGMELVLVMDNTGSMASSSKISTMRNAAKKLINVLYGSQETLDNFWVGLVPYVTGVNVGGDKFSWVSDYSPARYPANYPAGKTKWKGCVEARGNGLDVTDDPPDATDPNTLWTIYFWDDHNVDNNWIKNDGSINLYENKGYSNSGGKGPNIACGPAITPFTSVKSDIIDAISDMAPWRRGGTMSVTGLVWGWRLMSPRWRGLWAHEEAILPLDYDQPLMEKVVVILTDGQNQFYDGSSADPPKSDYSPYGRIEDGVMGTTSQNTGRKRINSRTEQICTSMKNEGIIIYTITFRLTGSSTADTEARALFERCATTPDYYYNSPDNATLDAVFASIGESLANLRISR